MSGKLGVTSVDIPKAVDVRVKAVARLRPFINTESTSDKNTRLQDALKLRLTDKELAKLDDPPEYNDGFDEILLEDVEQSKVYSATGAPLLDKMMEGIPVCLLAYGQTGSGKTHSLSGPPGMTGPRAYSQRGVVPRLLEDLMRRKENLDVQGVYCEVEVQMVEIYMDKMFDLLVPSSRALDRDSSSGSGGQAPASLGTRGLAAAKRVLLDRLETGQGVLAEGGGRQRQAATAASASSSRSHRMLVIHVMVRYPERTLRSVGYMVDLAGSEDVAQAKDRSQQVEGASINSSLYHLKQAVQDLAAGKENSLRSSKLTESLRGALSGNSLTCVLVAFKPTCGDKGRDAIESNRSVEFGMKVGRIKTIAQPVQEIEPKVEEAVAEVKVAEKKMKESKVATEVAACKLERNEAQAALDLAAHEARLRLEVERELLAAFLEFLKTSPSIFQILDFGISDGIKQRWGDIPRIMRENIKPFETAVDRGLYHSEAVIWRVYHKVEGWLGLWHQLLGVKHTEQPWKTLEWWGDLPSPSSPHTPTSSSSGFNSPLTSPQGKYVPKRDWPRDKIEALHEMTLEMQPELWELENQKDEMKTNFVRLSAGLNSVERAIEAVRAEVLTKSVEEQRDINCSREFVAQVAVTKRVLQCARQKWAEKQAAVDDKCEETGEHLHCVTSLHLDDFLQQSQDGSQSRLSKSAAQPLLTRLKAAESWRDTLPVAQDVLSEVMKEIDNPTPVSAVASSVAVDDKKSSPARGSKSKPQEDPAGAALGSGFTRLGDDDQGSQGMSVGAWVTAVKGVKRLNIKQVNLDPASKTYKVPTGAEGISLLAAHVKELCAPRHLEGVAMSLESSESSPQSYQADLDTQGPRLVGQVGEKRKVLTRMTVSQVQEQTGKYTVFHKMKVDIREWMVDKSSPSRKNLMQFAQQEMVPSDKGISLTKDEWYSFSEKLPQYKTLVK